jgi:hypothetical protein
MNPSDSIGSNIQITQYIAIAASIGLFIYISYLVRNKRIKEEYSLLWLFFSVVFIFFSVWREGLESFAKLVGIAYPPAALFIILLLAVFLILIEFSRIISRLTDRTVALAQEIAILKMELEKLNPGIPEGKKDNGQNPDEPGAPPRHLENNESTL